jgi:hypothetical protein
MAGCNPGRTGIRRAAAFDLPLFTLAWIAKEIVRPTIVLAIGLMLIALVLGVTLARSPSTLAGRNSVSATTKLGDAERDTSSCQAGETLPSGTSAIRLSLSSIIGSRVSVAVLSGSHILTSGTHGAGWTGGSVTIPVARVSHTVSHVSICFDLSDLNGKVELLGEHVPPALAAVSAAGQPLTGRFNVEYVRPGHRSWLSLASSVASHLSLGRSPSGLWIVFFAAIAVLAVVVLTSLAIVRELG